MLKDSLTRPVDETGDFFILHMARYGISVDQLIAEAKKIKEFQVPGMLIAEKAKSYQSLDELVKAVIDKDQHKIEYERLDRLFEEFHAFEYQNPALPVPEQ